MQVWAAGEKVSSGATSHVLGRVLVPNDGPES